MGAMRTVGPSAAALPTRRRRSGFWTVPGFVCERWWAPLAWPKSGTKEDEARGLKAGMVATL